MPRRFLAFVVLTCAAAAAAGSDDIALQELQTSLSATELTPRDIAAIGYVENMHAQLEHWADSLITRLERGLGPRRTDPMLDGRAHFQVKKLRLTYPGYSQSPSLAKAIVLLAERHEQRLVQIEAMMRYGVNRKAYAASRAQPGIVFDAIKAAPRSR